MHKSPENHYQPSQEEIKNASGMMTPEQQNFSEKREIIVKKIDDKFQNLFQNHAETLMEVEQRNIDNAQRKFPNYTFLNEEDEEVTLDEYMGPYESDYNKLSIELIEEAIKMYEADPDNAKEFALYLATYFKYNAWDDRNRMNALEQLAEKMAIHGHSTEMIEIIQNFPTSNINGPDNDSAKTNLLLNVALSAKDKDRDAILTYTKSLLEPRILEDYVGKKYLDVHHYRKYPQGAGDLLDYKLVVELFGEDYALSLVYQEVPTFGVNNDPKPYITQLYLTLGPERFAKDIIDQIDGDRFRNIILAKRFLREGGEWVTQGEINQKIEQYIEQGKKELLAGAIDLLEGKVSYRERFPDQDNRSETVEEINEGLNTLKSFRDNQVG